MRDTNVNLLPVEYLYEQFVGIYGFMRFDTMTPPHPGPATALPRRSVTVSAGVAATLSCPVSGYPLSDYQWRRGEVLLTPAPHRVLPDGRLSAAAPPGLSGGLYSCQATGGDGRRVAGLVDVVVIGE